MVWRKSHRRKISPLDRLSDGVARFTGSWTFIGLHVVWFALWFGFRLGVDHLTLILSVEAIFLVTILLMVSNRQERGDDAREETDLRTDLETERLVLELRKAIKDIRKHQKD